RGFMDQLVEINIYYYIILDRVARDRAGGPGRPLPDVRRRAGRADPRRPGPDGRTAPAPQVGGPAVPRLSRPDHGRDFLSRLAADPAFRRGTAAALGPTSQPFTLPARAILAGSAKEKTPRTRARSCRGVTVASGLTAVRPGAFSVRLHRNRDSLGW